MVDFKIDREAQEWLDKQPDQIAITIASRHALRVLPLIIVYQRDKPGEKFFRRVLSCFRANAVAWSCANFPTRNFRQQAESAAEDAFDAYIESATDADGAILFAYEATSRAAGPPSLPRLPPPLRRANLYIPYRSVAYADGYFAAAHQITADSSAIEQTVKDKQVAVAAQMAAAELWPGGLPLPFRSLWPRLRNTLLGVNQDWEVWVEWYENRLAGRKAAADLELAHLTIAEKVWARGPAIVNAEIRRLHTERLEGLPREGTLPTQTPRAATFRQNDNGVIDLVPPGPTDRLADTPEVRDLYAEVREKLTDLLSLGPNMLGNRLDRSARRFEARLPEQPSVAIERLVWSSGNTLRSILIGHDRVAGDYDPHPDKLDAAVAERLRDVTDTFNQLSVADPTLRQRDANRPGPQEHERSIEEIKVVVEVSARAASDRAITTADAGDELSESTQRTREAGNALPDRLAVELARDTHRNFFAGALVSVYRIVRNLPSAALGQGGFITKEYFSGIYKAAGHRHIRDCGRIRRVGLGAFHCLLC